MSNRKEWKSLMKKSIVILNGSPRAAGQYSSPGTGICRGSRGSGAQRNPVWPAKNARSAPAWDAVQGEKTKRAPVYKKTICKKFTQPIGKQMLCALRRRFIIGRLAGSWNAAFDRLFAVAECTKNWKTQKRKVYCWWRRKDTDSKKASIGTTGWCNILDGRSKGKILCGGVFQAGDIKGNKKLEDAFELGRNL